MKVDAETKKEIKKNQSKSCLVRLCVYRACAGFRRVQYCR